MRVLMVPGSNSPSHLFKCLAVNEQMKKRGHETLIVTSRKREASLKAIPHADWWILPDIQESDDAGLPTVEWFRRPQRIIDCMRAEIGLMEHYRPDVVLGVFRFTIKASCAAVGVPYYSLCCGCLLPGSGETMGFAPGEAGAELQAINLAGFFGYGGAKLSRAMTFFGLGPIEDARSMLRGRRTFLWDFPAFFPLEASHDLIHVGPIDWSAWPFSREPGVTIPEGRELAIVSFGTAVGNRQVAERIARLLKDMGFLVLLATGNQQQLHNLMRGEKDVIAESLPLSEVMSRASVIVTHGGQMTVFEALKNEVPVLVMPFQPEQAHTGVCLERMGCGARLVPAQPFRGNSRVYIDAFSKLSDANVRKRISGLLEDPLVGARLKEARMQIEQYGGARSVADSLEAV
jgi:UDP:flavonoid glycosyltransferase YjiC (YdhE family)